MIKTLKFTLCVFFLSFSVSQAQLILSPNQTPFKKSSLQSAAKDADSPPDTLSLPFFDDFSELIRDPNKWIDSGGVFINNEFGFEPISIGVATFDGFNENGEPYDFSTVVSEAIGVTDNLVSCPLDLSDGPDNTFLTFYWQKEGFGEIPDSEDTLKVQFKVPESDTSDRWITVWEQIGGTPLDTVIRTDDMGTPIDTVIVSRLDSNFSFIQEFIPLNNPLYFYKGFQFRFQSTGRLSGLYDAWNIDYVVLSDSINPQSFFPDEIAVSQQPNSLLQRYAAMPIDQYFANPDIETADAVTTTINNFSPPPLGDGPAYSVIVEDTNTNVITTLLDDSGLILINPQARNFVLDTPIPDGFLSETKDPLALKTSFIVSTGDGATGTLQLPGIDLRVNDTISTFTILDNYYAYDDGTAEYGAGINQRFGEVAVRYETNIPGTLTDVFIHLTRFEQDLVGQTYNLVIWQAISGVDGAIEDSVLFRINVPIRYPEARNRFESITEIKRLSDSNFVFQPVQVDGVFYVGWEQTTNDRLTVGYDRNNDATDQIFFNGGRGWQSFAIDDDDPIRQKERGSLMIRPVVGDVITSIGEELPDVDVKIFPNPASNRLFFVGEVPVRVEILDLQGSLRLSKGLASFSEKDELDISDLSPGIYVLKAIYPKKGGQASILTKRLVIVR